MKALDPYVKKAIADGKDDPVHDSGRGTLLPQERRAPTTCSR